MEDLPGRGAAGTFAARGRRRIRWRAHTGSPSFPGDGIGKETTPEGLRVLDAAARRFGFDLELTHYDWSCETYKQTGRMMPEDGLDQLARQRQHLPGRRGLARRAGPRLALGPADPDPPRLRPVRQPAPLPLMPGVRTPLANRTPEEIDFYVVRENTEGEYSSVGGRMFEGTDREFVSQQSHLHAAPAPTAS